MPPTMPIPPAVATILRTGYTTRDVTLTARMRAVECAIQTMHAHLHEVLTLEDLASAACLSPAHFNRIFHRMIGVPPVEYLTALRFQRARQLLLMTSLKITDICFEVGYTSTGSFTSRFTQMVGLSPRRLRERAHTYEPIPVGHSEESPGESVSISGSHALVGKIDGPSTFRGTIYVGLFRTAIPQGRPVRCVKLDAPGRYVLRDIADGVYYLRAAAFPLARDPMASLLPAEKLLLGNNPGPLLIHHGQAFGEPDLVLHSPRPYDPPLVMGLPLL
jgi:AraC family transcriptional regulator